MNVRGSEIVFYAPRKIHPHVVLYAAEQLGFNKVPEERLHLAFPYLKKKGFFKSGTYSIELWARPYSYELGTDLLALISIGEIEREGAPSSNYYYKLTRFGRKLTENFILKDERTKNDVLASKSVKEFEASVKEVLTKDENELIKEVFR
jgi:uncharacterized protein YwgA